MTELPEDFLRNPERFVDDLALLESGNAPGWRRWSLNTMDDGKAREWVKKPSWSLAEAEFLLFGLEAKQVNGTWSFFPIASNAGETTDWFMRDIGAGNLVPSGVVKGIDAYRPTNLVASAKRGNIGLWQIWEGYLLADIDAAEVASSDQIHSQQPEEIRKRAALIKEVECFWPSIDRDLRDAARNSLSAARHTTNTFWNVGKALTWATQRGKVTKEKARLFISNNSDSALSPMLRNLLKLD